MRIELSDLSKLVSEKPEFKLGCIVDTNALFAAAMPLDRLNEWAEAAFKELRALEIHTFTNINIRSEFMDLQRRVLIPEGLVTFYDQPCGETMDGHLKTQLRLLKTSKDKSKDKLFKFNDQQMKKYRNILKELPGPNGMNSWDWFCENFLHPFIVNVWEENIAFLKVKFVGTRAIESREYFDRDPSWKDMTDIIGRFGIGSSDAMIINFFLCSQFPLIVTGDEDVAYAVERLSGGKKFILIDKKVQSEAA